MGAQRVTPREKLSKNVNNAVLSAKIALGRKRILQHNAIYAISITTWTPNEKFASKTVHPTNLLTT